MKNKIAIASAFFAASSFATAEIVVNDFLSFEGFVDMSYVYNDGEFAGANESENSFAIDQVEISWLFDFDPVTAQVDLQYEGADNDFGNGSIVEQAFATYHFADGSAITAGRYASMLGFEAFEPTGLYQYSVAYDLQIAANALLADGITTVEIIPDYAQGVKYTNETENTFFGISVQDEVFDVDGSRLGGDGDNNSVGGDGTYGIEAAYSVALDNGLAWFLGGAWEEGEDGDSYIVNTYLTYETGAWIFAAELNYGESENDSFAVGTIAPVLVQAFNDASGDFLSFTGDEEEVIQALLMANYAYSDRASWTGRVSYVDHELEGDAVLNGVEGSGSLELDALKYTLAHGYAFTDNLFLVNEISYVDGEIDDLDDFDSILFATELIFSF